MTKDEKIKRFGCIDCEPRRIGEQYMIDDRLWYLLLRLGRKDNLCLPHLELRLADARPLAPLLSIDDFTAAPINDGVRFGFTMGCRSAWDVAASEG